MVSVGEKIEQAIDASLASENSELNMEIYDMINESSDAARDAMKAIRKRLSQNAGKNYTMIMYTLTVLEKCVKNCGKEFHVLVANKEFIQNLVKLIEPENDPSDVVKNKVLNLIQFWADAFRSQPDLNGVVQVYQELKSKGIEFPVADLDDMAPIYTPQRSVPERASPPVALSASPKNHPDVTQANPTPVVTIPSRSLILIPEQIITNLLSGITEAQQELHKFQTGQAGSSNYVNALCQRLNAMHRELANCIDNPKNIEEEQKARHRSKRSRSWSSSPDAGPSKDNMKQAESSNVKRVCGASLSSGVINHCNPLTPGTVDFSSDSPGSNSDLSGLTDLSEEKVGPGITWRRG